MIKDFVKDTAKYLPSYVVPAIVGMISIPVFTRLFSPGDYGRYTLVVSAASVLSMICTVWLSAAVIRFFPIYKLDNRLGEFNGTVGKLTLVSIAAIFLMTLCVLLLVPAYGSENLHSLIRIGMLLFIATSFYNIFLGAFRSKRQVSWYTSTLIWRSIAGFGLGVALVLVFKCGVSGLLWGSFLSMVVISPLLWKIAIGKLSLREGHVYSRMSLRMFRYGLPVAVVNIADWILSVSDRYMLQFFRGSHEVGIYSANYAISLQTINVIASLLLLASGPIGYNIWENQGLKASQEFLGKVARYHLLIGLPAVVGLGVLAKPVVEVLTAPEYYSGYRIVPLVAFGVFLYGLTNTFGIGFTFYKKTSLLMSCVLSAALVNIGLNFLFIPTYGYMAAAATTLLCCALLLALVVFISRTFFTWRFPFKSLFKITCASVLMGTGVYCISNGLRCSNLLKIISGIGIGVPLYFMALSLFREFQSTELEVLFALKTNILGKRKFRGKGKGRS